jgi:7-cyano-7-deazaguanine reductase
MKLYWNSFNMTKFGETIEDVASGIEFHAAADLSKLLQTEVKVKLFSCDTDLKGVSNPFLESYDAVPNSLTIIPTKKYVRLEHFLKSDINITKYREDPSIFDTKYTSMAEPNNLNVMSSLLKSNCRVTSQPDWGDVFIHIEGHWLPGVKELLEYIVSFRDENHFHEEICETIYKRLYDRFSPRELMVACLYARRGGWDINPVRANKIDLIDDMMWDETIPWIKTIRQ